MTRQGFFLLLTIAIVCWWQWERVVLALPYLGIAYVFGAVITFFRLMYYVPEDFWGNLIDAIFLWWLWWGAQFHKDGHIMF